MFKKALFGLLAVVALALALTVPVEAQTLLNCTRTQWPPSCGTGPIAQEHCSWDECTACAARCCLWQYMWCGSSPNQTLEYSRICSSYCGGQGDWE